MMPKHYVNYFVLLMVALLWGGSFVAIKFAILAWPPFFSVVLRMLFTLLALVVINFLLNKSVKINFALRWRIWIIGIFALGIPFTSLFWGERFVAPGLAGIINSTTLIWVFLFSLVLFKQEQQHLLLKIAGILTGFLGIIIIFWPMLKLDKTHMELLGAVAVLIMALSYAIASILNQYFFTTYGKIDLYTNLYHQTWGALGFALLLSAIFEKWPSWHIFLNSTDAILGTLYLGIGSTAIGWLLYYHLIREWGAVRANLTSYLVPITALLDDYLFFHRIPLISEIIGVVIILLAVFMINSTKKT